MRSTMYRDGNDMTPEIEGRLSEACGQIGISSVIGYIDRGRRGHEPIQASFMYEMSQTTMAGENNEQRSGVLAH